MRKLALLTFAVISVLAVLSAGCAKAGTTTAAISTPAVTTTAATTSAATASATTAEPTATTTPTQTGSGPGTGTSTPTATTAAGAVLLKVTKAGAVLKNFSLGDVDKFPTVSIVADGKNYDGPTINTLLSQAGVTSFAKITIKGFVKGRMATAELVVAKENVNDKLILRRTNSATYSLASPDIDADSWIIDVNEIVVE